MTAAEAEAHPYFEAAPYPKAAEAMPSFPSTHLVDDGGPLLGEGRDGRGAGERAGGGDGAAGGGGGGHNHNNGGAGGRGPKRPHDGAAALGGRWAPRCPSASRCGARGNKLTPALCGGACVAQGDT